MKFRDTSADLARNVSLIFVLQLLMGLHAITLPIMVVFWRECGMDMTEIMLLQAIFAIALAVCEVPSGYMADLFGRRKALLIGWTMIAIGSIIYVTASTFAVLVIVELFLAFGMSCCSGADQALLYDSLKQLKREHEAIKLWGRGQAAGYYFMGASAIVGSPLGAIDVRLPLMIVGVLALIALACCLGLVEASHDAGQDHKRGSLRELSRLAGQSLFVQPRLRWLLLYPAMILGLGNVALWMYQPYFALGGVEIQYVGLIFALFNLVAAWSSRRAASLVNSWSERKVATVCLLAMASSYLLMGSLLCLFSFSFALLQQWVRGFMGVAYAQYLNESVNSARRATMLSLQSLGARAVYALALVPVGWICDEHGFLAAMLITGGMVLALGLVAQRWLFEQEV